MNTPQAKANNQPAYTPAPVWRVALTSVIALSAVLTVGPMLSNTIRGLSKEHLLLDVYIVTRALLIVAGFLTIHFAAYKAFVTRKYKRAVIVGIIGYAFITLGVCFGWLVFSSN